MTLLLFLALELELISLGKSARDANVSAPNLHSQNSTALSVPIKRRFGKEPVSVIRLIYGFIHHTQISLNPGRPRRRVTVTGVTGVRELAAVI